MKSGIVLERLRSAVDKGSVVEVQTLLEDVHPEEPVILSARYETGVWIKRPSTGTKIEVRQPSLLMIAVTGWFPTIVETLLSLGADVGDTSEIFEEADSTSSRHFVTPLILSAISGRVQHAKVLLENGALVNARDSQGNSALIETCREDHQSVLELLVSYGASIELANERHVTPLMTASEFGNMAAFKTLINLGADVNKADIDGRNALFYCIDSPTQSKELFKRLINSGCRISSDNNTETVLMFASGKGDLEMVKFLLENKAKYTIDVNTVDQAGKNALYHACEGGSLETVELLLQYSAVVRTAKDGSTLIMAAAGKQQNTVLNFLVSNSVKMEIRLDAKDNNGRNTLFYAVDSNSLSVFTYLRDCGVTEARGSDGVNLLMYAVANGKLNLANHLLENEKICPELSEEDSSGRNILFYAVRFGDIELFNRLYMLGAVPLVTKEDGRNLLMEACGAGQPEIAGFLFENRATLELDLHSRDSTGRNLLFYCVDGGSPAILDFFLGHLRPEVGPDGFTLVMRAAQMAQANVLHRILALPEIQLDSCDDKGRNALFYSVMSGRVAMLQLLLERGLSVKADAEGTTLMMLAAQKTCPKVLDFLLEHGPRLGLDVNAVDSRGRNILFYALDSKDYDIFHTLQGTKVKATVADGGTTLLMAAASRGNRTLIGRLIDYKESFALNPDDMDNTGENVFFYALRSNSPEVLSFLANRRYNICCNSRGESIVSLCYEKGFESSARDLLAAVRAECLHAVLNGKDNHGRSAFHHFVTTLSLDLLNKYSDSFDALKDGDHSKTTLLMVASSSSSTDALECIFEKYRVIPTAVDVEGRSALFIAAATGFLQGCKLLLAHGLKPTITAHDGSTILHVAVQGRNVNILRHFLRFFNADVASLLSKSNNNGQTIGHLICHKELVEFVEEVVKWSGFEAFQIPNPENQTALMVTCATGNLQIFQILAKCPDIKAQSLTTRDVHGYSALHHACVADKPSHVMVKTLLDWGLPVNESSKDSCASTPLMMAIQRDSLKVVKLLLESGADPFLQDGEDRNSFDVSTTLKNSVIQVYFNKEFGIQRTQERFLSLCQRHHPGSVDMTIFLRAMADQDLIISRQNCRDICSEEADARRRWFKLIDIVSRRGRTRTSEFCDFVEAYFSTLSEELRRAIN